MSFIAMNRFKVRHGYEAEFEAMWAKRQSRLREMKGFCEFRLLKGRRARGTVSIPVMSSGPAVKISRPGPARNSFAMRIAMPGMAGRATRFWGRRSSRDSRRSCTRPEHDADRAAAAP